MATGDTASDPFSRSAQHGRSRPRGCAASGCDDRHHVGLLPRAVGRSFVAEQPDKRRSETTGDQQMPATLKVTHKAIGAEVRRGTYDVVVDGERPGSVEMDHTIEIPVEPGRHTLQVRNGRNSSSTQTFDAAEEISSPSDVPERGSCRSFCILCRAQAGTETHSRFSRRRVVARGHRGSPTPTATGSSWCSGRRGIATGSAPATSLGARRSAQAEFLRRRPVAGQFGQPPHVVRPVERPLVARVRTSFADRPMIRCVTLCES